MASDDYGIREKRSLNELVLPAGEFAYTRDTTSGATSVRCGPTVVNAQAQDEPVVYDPTTGRFSVVSLMQAAQVNIVVPTGCYAVLNNPSIDDRYPEQGNKNIARDLRVGQKVHIPGPISFALWPRQHANVIEGHQLRSNQYLIVRVYDEEAAKANWAKAVVKKATVVVQGETPATELVAVAENVPQDLSVGRLLVIRGTEVSFYIPPTGIEVVPDEGGCYVREALTLERLQYCILIDESGEKRYVRGPAVVFPRPTERFHTSQKGDRHFRPVELNGEIQGIHVKVISDYVDERGDHGPKGARYKEGDELFITGKTTPIYFPCEQHSAIKYDGKTKHFATAIPAGDGRYVMNRHSGTIRTINGGGAGTVYLPDPREEVFVRRVLSDSECTSMYPGNKDAFEYNGALRQLQFKAPVTRKGVVTDGELTRNAKFVNASYGNSLTLTDAEFADVSTYGQSMDELSGTEFVRAATYTEPRTLTLGNNKFAGVPKLNLWTGYAVMVVDTSGNRRVEIGPKRIILDFNETLEVLTLSTGVPKTTDKLFSTAYLQIAHNKVSDFIEAETSDHVIVRAKVAYRVNFEGADSTKWFGVANYVKLLCDHGRSVLKAAIRQMTVEEFFKRSEDFIRDSLLGVKPTDGSKRQGMLFEENGMRVYDVEVLNVIVGDTEIQKLLSTVQHEAVRSSIELAQDHRRLEAAKQREVLKREEANAKAETDEAMTKLALDGITRTLMASLAETRANIDKYTLQLELQKHKDNVALAAVSADIERKTLLGAQDIAQAKDREEIRLHGIQLEAQARIDQLKAVESGFSEALLALGNQDTLTKIAEAMSVQTFVGGSSLVDVIRKVFAGTQMEATMDKVAEAATTTRSRKRVV